MDSTMKHKPIDILLVEDNPRDAIVIQEILKEARHFSYKISVAETVRSGLEHLQKNKTDIILLDLNLPDSRGEQTFEAIYNLHEEIPIILESGLEDEELAIKLIHRGAQDYITKTNLDTRTLERSITYSLERSKLRKSLHVELNNKAKAEEELLKAKNKAEESDRLKSAFLANVSHEIRTPLNAIVGFSGLFSDPDLSLENRIQYSEIIKSRSDDLVSIIGQILEISRIESGNEIVIKKQVVINDILEELEANFRKKLQQIKKTNLQLVCEKALSADQFRIITDGDIVKRVFYNLIDNAIKFTESGTIRFGYQLPDNHILTCYVSDTGIGIFAENQELIFEHFRQAELVDQKKLYGGTGLGLSICKGSLTLLGGKIWVESISGEGSTFYFTIPMERGTKDKGRRTMDEGRRTTDDGYQWKGKKLLLVEDEESNIEYLKVILTPFQAELVYVENARKLRDLYGILDTFDMVLLDIRLPDADGWELAKEIKAIRPDLPVIAQTAYAMASDRQKSEEVGCDDYISKPINKELLFKKISASLRQGELKSLNLKQ